MAQSIAERIHSGTRRYFRRILSAIAVLLVAALFVGALAGGTMLIRVRAGDVEAPPPQPAMPVATLKVSEVPFFEVEDRYVGRLEPARSAHLAFERGGLVMSVSVDEGDRVSAGDVIATIDSALMRAERIRLEADRARLEADRELAAVTEERQERLNERGHASQQVLDEARLRRVALDGAIASVDASIARLDIDIGKSEITAPFAGTIAARELDPGQVVSSGTAVVELLESGRPQARVGVSPEAAAELSRGDSVTLASNGYTLSGVIAAVRPDLAPSTRTVGVVVDVDAPDTLRFGDTVTLAVSRKVNTSGFWVPIDALREGERGLWTVLTALAAEDGHVVGRESVELLHVEGDRALVRGTLRAGQEIIATGRHRVIPGQRIAPSLSAGGEPAA